MIFETESETGIFRVSVLRPSPRPKFPESKTGIFAGAARRAGPDSMSIVDSMCMPLCKIISRPLIGRKSSTLAGFVRRS